MRKARQIKTNLAPSNQTIQHVEQELIRLNKFISSSGVCSRREADRYIEEGLVTIDGEIAQTGTKIASHQQVCVNGQIINTKQQLVYLILHKPIGIDCTTDISKPDNIITYLHHPQRIFPIGRLDKDSSGLIMLTNDGDVVNEILRSSNEHEKEYIVSVNKTITPVFLENLRNGVTIYNPVSNAYQTTKPCKVYQEDARSFRIILSEGLNRQIRRMCTVNDYHVQTLKRIRIMNIVIDGLQVGDWRYLSDEEIIALNKQLCDSK